MVRYDDLAAVVESMPAESASWQQVIPALVDRWADDYSRTSRNCDIVETDLGGFSYLFDVEGGRLIAAWGVSEGVQGGKRPESRMRGHPLGAGKSYHRGHAIPHNLGGGTDINLVPQLGSINKGDFRTLEIQAEKAPGALYFSYWRYFSNWQTPAAVDQGLLVAGKPPSITRHRN